MKPEIFIIIGIVMVGIGAGVFLWQAGYFEKPRPETPEIPTPPSPPSPPESPEPIILVPQPITPTPVNPPVEPVEEQPKGQYYTTTKKDKSLWSIAKKFYGKGSLWTIIQQANLEEYPELANPNRGLKPGMKLFIPAIEETPSAPRVTPQTTPSREAPAKVIYHTVVKGDTLRKLALKYYKDPTKASIIFEANRDKLATPQSPLKIGWKLKIPVLSESQPSQSQPESQ